MLRALLQACVLRKKDEAVPFHDNYSPPFENMTTPTSGRFPTTHTHHYQNGTPFATKKQNKLQTNIIGVATPRPGYPRRCRLHEKKIYRIIYAGMCSAKDSSRLPEPTAERFKHSPAVGSCPQDRLIARPYSIKPTYI